MDAPAPLEHHAQVAAFSRRHRTGLVTIVFTDIVGSTALKERLGDQAGTGLIQEHHALVRGLLRVCAEAEEISTAGDSFLILFARPSDAVEFALGLMAKLRAFNQGRAVPLQDRVGIHLGEVVIAQGEGEAKAKDLHGVQVDVCARVMGLAQAGQILLSRAVFDNARQSLKGEEIEGVGSLVWLNHGLFALKGVEAPLEVCEVRTAEAGLLSAPTTSEKARRVEAAEGEAVLGWRPALGQAVPQTRWVLEQKLGEGGFGEVWVGRHQAMKERRVFKFCFRADRARSLKREMTLFRLIKERIGDHPNIVSLREVYFDQPPFYVEMDYVAGQDLRTWCQAQGGLEKVLSEVKLEIVAQVADALQAAHDAGVIHRDVKPGNILVSGVAANWRSPHSALSGPASPTLSEEPPEEEKSAANTSSPLRVQAKLTDFGIGQVVSEEYLAGVTRAGFTQTMMSSSSSQTGTQLYMAPELLAGKPASTRSDIYSLGVVLYQLLAGDFTRPVTTDWADNVADPLTREDLKHCFAGKPENRFTGAGQLARQLRGLPERRAELLQQQAAVEQAARSAARRAALKVGTLAAVIVAVFALLTIWAIRQSRLAANMAREAQMNLYDADMLLAFQAHQQGNLGRLRELLAKHSPTGASNLAAGAGRADLRGWEWRYLWQQARGDDLVVLRGHSNVVHGAEMLHDGRTVASAGYDHTIRFWDSKTGALLETIRFPDEARCTALSPDGRWLVVGGRLGIWNLWDAGRRELRLAWTNAMISWGAGAAFSPDSTLLAAADDTAVEIWDLRSFKRTKRIDRSTGGTFDGFVFGVAFSPDGSRIAYAHADDRIMLYDLTTGAEETVGKAQRGDALTLAFTADGRTLVSGDRANLSLWDVPTRKLLRHLTNHVEQVVSVALSRDSKLMASASGDHTVRLWDTKSWQQVRVLRGHEDEVYSIRFSPDGKRLVSGGKDDTVRVWGTEVDQYPRES